MRRAKPLRPAARASDLKIVLVPVVLRRSRARSMTALTSARPACTALCSSNAACEASATSRASVRSEDRLGAGRAQAFASAVDDCPDFSSAGLHGALLLECGVRSLCDQPRERPI